MKISLIIPVYNVEKYLEQCLQSILVQSYTNLEIIIVNDGSTDGSLNICNAFAAKDRRIKVLTQLNGGVSVARNAGIEVATGNYLAFVDSDDWLEPDMVEKMVAEISKKPTLDLVMCDTTLIMEDFKLQSTDFIRQGYYLKDQIVSDLYPYLLATEDFGKIPIASICNCLLKRSVLIENRIRFDRDLKYSEDYLFVAELLTTIKSFYYLKDHYLYNYRQYEESRSKKLQPDWWNNLVDLNEKSKKLLSDSKEFNFEKQLKLQLIHSALFVAYAIAKNETLHQKIKLKNLENLFNDSRLQDSFSNLIFDKQRFSLKIVLFLLKNRMALTYLMYRRLISKVKIV